MNRIKDEINTIKEKLKALHFILKFTKKVHPIKYFPSTILYHKKKKDRNILKVFIFNIY